VALIMIAGQLRRVTGVPVTGQAFFAQLDSFARGTGRMQPTTVAVAAAVQRPGHPHDLTPVVGDDLQVHPVAAVLAGVERPVGGDPVDRDQGAVDDQAGVPGIPRPGQRPAQLRGPGGPL